MNAVEVANVIAQLRDEWQTEYKSAMQLGWVRHASIADAYEDEPRGAVSWWLGQVTKWGEAVDLFVVMFWALVDQATVDGRFDPERLVDALSHRSYEEIARFHRTFDQVHRLAYDESRRDEMWKAGWWYSRGLCTNDGLDDFVCGLVFLGEATYRGILQHPQRLLTVSPLENPECESNRYLARDAFEQKAERENDDLDFWDYIEKG